MGREWIQCVSGTALVYLLPLVGATFDRLSNIMEALAEREKNIVHPHTLGAQPCAPN